MKTYPTQVALASILSTFVVSAAPVGAQDLKAPMQEAFGAYRSLQPFLADEQRFVDEKNTAQVSQLLKTMRDDFHGVSAFPNQFTSQPGFVSNVNVISETLEDAVRRFDEGRKSYAAWRMRAVSSNCLSCHATYNVELKFQPSDDADLAGLSAFQKGEFYMATRQLDKAEKSYLEALAESGSNFQSMSVLRRLLMLNVRIKGDAKNAVKKMTEATKDLTLPERDREEVNAWLTALTSWAAQKSDITSVAAAANIIKRASGGDDPFGGNVDAVALLRAIRALHRMTESEKTTANDRSQALYLLGVSYGKIPFFFIGELPGLYLKQCIEEAPGTPLAKQAYKRYAESVEEEFTGSSGTDLPGDIKTNLMEMHDKAYGITPMNGKV